MTKRWNESDDPVKWRQREEYLRNQALNQPQRWPVNLENAYRDRIIWITISLVGVASTSLAFGYQLGRLFG